MDIKETGKDFGDLLADRIDFKNKIVEAWDNPAFKIVFGQLFQMIPEVFHDEVAEVVSSFKSGEITQEMEDKIVGFLNEIIRKALTQKITI